METPPVLLVGSALIICYCLPSIVAFVRQHSAMPWICVVNICLGWTVLGWLVAMAWSITRRNRYRFRLKTADRPSACNRVTMPTQGVSYPVKSNDAATLLLRGERAHSSL